MILETFPLFSVILFVYTGTGKEAKGSTELRSSTIVYFTSYILLFFKCCLLCSFVPKHLLQPLLHEAFEKTGKINL